MDWPNCVGADDALARRSLMGFFVSEGIAGKLGGRGG